MKPERNRFNGEPQRSSRRLLSVCLLSLVMVAGWTGCEKAAKVAAEVNPAGTYALVSVDGKAVPCTVQHEGRALTVKSGTFIINRDGTCSSKVSFSPPSGGDVLREVKASYTQQGAKLTMKWEGAGTTTGTLEGDTFTMNNEGMIFAYRR